MIKKWAEKCSVNLKSYKIENIVLDFLAQDVTENKDNSIIIKNFFAFAHDKEIDGNIKSYFKTAKTRSQKACDLDLENKIDKATDEWKKIFGDDFPKLQNKKSILNEFIDNYPSPNEQFLSDFGVMEKIQYNLKINANVKQHGFRDNILTLVSFLKKELWLNFYIEKTNAPGNYKIWWKVKNQGEEARVKNDLRGEIYMECGNTRKEHTKYYGTHYVECYLIINNICVAKDRIFVKIN